MPLNHKQTESLLEYKTYKILCDFSIETDHSISARKPELDLIKKKKRKRHQVDFSKPVDQKVKRKSKQILGSFQWSERSLVLEGGGGGGDTNYRWCARNGLQGYVCLFGWVLWHINFYFNAKSILYNKQFYFKHLV